MDFFGTAFYLVMASIAYLAFRRRSLLLTVPLAVAFGCLAIGLLALISTHQFDFFSRQNVRELMVGNVLALVLRAVFRLPSWVASRKRQGIHED